MKYIGLIEMTLVFAAVIGFCLWQLRSLGKADQTDRKKTSDPNKDDE